MIKISLFNQIQITPILTLFLPFLIIFLILYALLQKSKIFGDGNLTTVKRINGIISATIAAIVVFINPFGINWAIIFGYWFSSAVILLIFLAFLAIFALMISTGRLERTPQGIPKVGWLSFIIGVTLAAIALSVSGVLPVIFPETLRIDVPEYTPLILLIVVIVIFIGLGYLFTRP